MAHAVFVVSVLICAGAFALLEIQIEGEAGWAKGLPTWRVDTRLTRLLFGGRELTGYHLYAHLTVLTLLHLPYGLSLVPFGLQVELRLLAFLVLFWIAEDYLWFVCNPRFGVARFRREFIPWHAHSWWWIMPREYWIFLPIGFALYGLSLA